MKQKLLIVLVLFLLASCAAPAPLPMSTLAQTSTPFSTITPSSLTPTQIASTTSTPTVIPTATVTPTPVLPVGQGTPVPSVNTPITIESVNQLRELARYGTGLLQESLFSSDGRILILATTGGLHVYDVVNKTFIQKLNIYLSNNNRIRRLSLAADARLLMAATNNAIQVYEIGGEKVWEKIMISPAADNPDSFSASLSPDGNLAAISTCREWFDCNFDVIRLGDSHVIFSGKGEQPAFTPDGKYLALLIPNQMVLWSTTDWKRYTDFPYDENNRYAFSPKGTYIAFTFRDHVEVWRLDGRKMIRTINQTSPEAGQILFSQNENWLAVRKAYSQNVSIWNVLDGNPKGNVEIMNYIPSHPPIYLKNDGSLVEENLAELVSTTPSYFDPFLVISPEDDQLFYSYTGFENPAPNEYIRVENFCNIHLSAPSKCEKLVGNTGILVNPDSTLLYWQMDKDKKEFSINRGPSGDDPLVTLPTYGSEFRAIAVSPDEHLVIYSKYTPSSQSFLVLHDIPNQKKLLEINASNPDLAFFGSGEDLVMIVNDLVGHSSGSNSLYKIELRSGNVTLKKTFRNPGLAGALAEMPDGQSVVFFTKNSNRAKDETYTIQSLGISESKFVPRSVIDIGPGVFPSDYSVFVEKLGIPPDGKVIFAGLSNGEILCIDLGTGELVYQWQAHADRLSNLTFSQDGTMLATSAEDGFVKIWGIYP